MPVYRLGSTTYEVRLEPVDEVQGRWRLLVGDRAYTVRVLHRDAAHWVLEMDGRQVTVHAQWDGVHGWATYRGRTYRVTRGPQVAQSETAATGGDGTLRAPMPAQVRAVQVEAGQTVTAGQTLLVLEAMKMELRIQAPFAGRVQEVRVQVGDAVEREQVLAVGQPTAEAS